MRPLSQIEIIELVAEHWFDGRKDKFACWYCDMGGAGCSCREDKHDDDCAVALAHDHLDAIKAIQAQHTPTESICGGPSKNEDVNRFIDALNTPEPGVEDLHACKTGDCPHWEQSECDAELAKPAPIASETLKRVRECLEAVKIQTGFILYSTLESQVAPIEWAAQHAKNAEFKLNEALALLDSQDDKPQSGEGGVG